MSLFSSLFSSADTPPARRQQSYYGGGLFANLGSGSNAGVQVTQSNALGLTAVMCAITTIADALAMLPVIVIQNKNGKSSRPQDHPVSHLLNLMPNPEEVAFTLKQRFFGSALTHGNGYLELARNGRGDLAELWSLLPDRTRPEKKRNEDLRYITTIDGVHYSLPRDNILHLKAFGQDSFVGLSPIALHRNTLGVDFAVQEFAAKFFANDAKSGGFLQHPGKLGDEAVKNLTESVNRRSGLDNAHRIRVLEEGMKFVTTSIPPDDAQFLATREFQIEEVARMYKIPPILLQSLSKTTSWGSGIEQMMIHFIMTAIQPWVTQMEQLLTSKLLTEAERKSGLFVKLNVNALLRGDMAARKEFYKAAINDGWMSREEVRDLEDLPYQPGLDKFLRPLNMTDGSEDDAL